MTDKIKIITENRKAYHDYHIHERMEAGMVLKGTEIKSLRMGKAHLRDSYAEIRNEELFLVSCHISPYDPASQFNHDPLRRRKLLMHKKEIQKLFARIEIKGFSLIPLKIYFKGGMAKVELGIATGKKEFDKRESIKKKEADMDIAKAMKQRVT
ncbi:MAG: SsrA-binding protein SmpB [Nitrospinae bacterium]|nr:SsrA-binding protein SmpB [Nitrospinota bacterium]